jgi:hypothetical protein
MKIHTLRLVAEINTTTHNLDKDRRSPTVRCIYSQILCKIAVAFYSLGFTSQIFVIYTIALTTLEYVCFNRTHSVLYTLLPAKHNMTMLVHILTSAANVIRSPENTPKIKQTIFKNTIKNYKVHSVK